MQTEFEVKILDINLHDIQNKLKLLNTDYIWEKYQKRLVYDFNPAHPWKWIRLRQKWDKVELTIKEIIDDSITWTKELEIWVSDFETTNLILEKLGYKAKAFQENKRISYKLDWVEIEIDSWPLIPTYLEIEWKSELEVKKIVEKLWYKISDTTSINTTKVYKKYWIDIEKIKELKF